MAVKLLIDPWDHPSALADPGRQLVMTPICVTQKSIGYCAVVAAATWSPMSNRPGLMSVVAVP
jgi:hypothetical protein